MSIGADCVLQFKRKPYTWYILQHFFCKDKFETSWWLSCKTNPLKQLVYSKRKEFLFRHKFFPFRVDPCIAMAVRTFLIVSVGGVTIVLNTTYNCTEKKIRMIWLVYYDCQCSNLIRIKCHWAFSQPEH